MLLCCLGFFLLITEALILVDWGPTVTKHEYGVLIASISVVYGYSMAGWPGFIPVFMLLLASNFQCHCSNYDMVK